MSERSHRVVTAEAPAEADLAELRSLLLGPEQRLLLGLRERLENSRLRAEDVSEVLAEAIVRRAERDRSLSSALLPTVEEALTISVRRDPRRLVEALFPIMGPAIRKAVADAIRGAVESLNHVIEHSVSPRSLKWRLLALRTGKPFAEIVLLHTLLYRVDQVFLIHKRTGLLLQHVVADAVAAQDAGMVSGMLTAIQDFVRDSFGVADGEGLEALRVGDLMVWVAEGPHAVLAAVIRGNAPPGLRVVLAEALERIHLEQGDALASFQGDAAPFETSRPHLDLCLRSQYRADSQPSSGGSSPGVSRALWAAAGVALLAVAVGGGVSIRSARRWSDYLERLRAEPGIVVTSTERRGGRYHVSGLRDPLAADPTALLQESQLDPADVVGRWEPYQALRPEFIVARARQLLAPPPTVSLRYEGDTLYATGSASTAWIAEARNLARAVPGVAAFRDAGLVDSDLERARARLERSVVRFLANTRLAAGQEQALAEIVSSVQALDAAAHATGQAIVIEVAGHTDRSGSAEVNARVSRERAQWIVSLLAASGLRATRLQAVSAGTAHPVRPETTESNREWNRSATFKVTVAESRR